MMHWLDRIISPSVTATAPPAIRYSVPAADPPATDGIGVEIILIIVAALLTLVLLGFFVYVFTRKSE
jgi:hypothetical protein